MPLSQEQKDAITNDAIPLLIEEAKAAADAECEKCEGVVKAKRAEHEEAKAEAVAAEKTAAEKLKLLAEAERNLQELERALPGAQHEARVVADAGGPEAKELARQVVELEAGISKNQKIVGDCKSAFASAEQVKIEARSKCDACKAEVSAARAEHTKAKQKRDELSREGVAAFRCLLEHHDMLGDDAARKAYCDRRHLENAQELVEKKKQQLAKAEAELVEREGTG